MKDTSIKTNGTKSPFPCRDEADMGLPFDELVKLWKEVMPNPLSNIYGNMKCYGTGGPLNKQQFNQVTNPFDEDTIPEEEAS
jgi:hypothetical protein